MIAGCLRGPQFDTMMPRDAYKKKRKKKQIVVVFPVFRRAIFPKSFLSSRKIVENSGKFLVNLQRLQPPERLVPLSITELRAALKPLGNHRHYDTEGLKGGHQLSSNGRSQNSNLVAVPIKILLAFFCCFFRRFF